MFDDNMQHIFLCPKCGAQNVVGQLVCQSCGQRFQYNCPYCGFLVDPSLVNCPSCRGMLNWPVPQKVKAFPRQKAVLKAPKRAQRRAQGPLPGQMPGQMSGQMSGGFEQEPGKKKRDPWLTGCLIAIIIVVLIGGAIFVIDTLNQGPTTNVPPSPASENESRIQPFQTQELALSPASREVSKHNTLVGC